MYETNFDLSFDVK